MNTSRFASRSMGHLGVHEKGAHTETTHRACCFARMTRLWFLFGFFCDVSCCVHALLTRMGHEHCIDLHYSQADAQACEPFQRRLWCFEFGGCEHTSCGCQNATAIDMHTETVHMYTGQTGHLHARGFDIITKDHYLVAGRQTGFTCTLLMTCSV